MLMNDSGLKNLWSCLLNTQPTIKILVREVPDGNSDNAVRNLATQEHDAGVDAVQADHFLQEEQQVSEPQDSTEVVQDVTRAVDKSGAPWQCCTLGHLAP